MFDKNIQMKKREGNYWDNLYPITTNENVLNNEGINLEDQLENIENNMNLENSKLKNSLKETNDNIHSINDNIHSISVNVKFPPSPYTAVLGDGVTDDSETIQALLDDENISELFFPEGHYIIKKPLFMRYAKNIKGVRVGKTIIEKKGNVKLSTGESYKYVGSERSIYYDDYDAILITNGYMGDFEIEGIEFRGDENYPNSYGLLLPYTYRISLEKLMVLYTRENIRMFATWNTNIKKVRTRFSDYGIRIEGINEGFFSKEQSTSVNFDNVFTEYSKFGLKLVHLTYFSGSSISSDFIDESGYWFILSQGSFNGVGNEASTGQIIRSWLSNVNVTGLYVLNTINRSTTTLEAKSNAKIEVWSKNRTDTGLTILSGDIRSLSGTGNVHSYHASGYSSITLINFRDVVLTNARDSDVLDGSTINRISNSEISLSGRGRSSFNGLNVDVKSKGYNLDEFSSNQDGFTRTSTFSNQNISSLDISISDVQKRFGNFFPNDNFLAKAYLMTITYGAGTTITDIYLYGNRQIQNDHKVIGGGKITATVTAVQDNLNITFSEPIKVVRVNIKEL